MKYKKFKEHIYDTSDVVLGYNYWFEKLLAYCLNIFEYEGLPYSLPSRQIEGNLILTGHALIFNDKEYGWTTVESNLYGYNRYYDPNAAVYAQPVLGSKNVSLYDENTFIIYNSDLQSQILGYECDGSLRGFISRYARMLADIESTISIRLVDIRTPNMAVSDDSTVQESVKSFYNKITMGERTIVSDSSIVPQLSNIDLNKYHMSDTVTDLLIARDKILEMFYRDIGVRFYQTKKAQVNSEEVTANNSMFVVSLDDMLRMRQEGFNLFNYKTGYNVTVKINKNWGIDYAKTDTDNQ